jgi:hypothetical protein
LNNAALSGIARDIKSQDLWVRYDGGWYRAKQLVGIKNILNQAQKMSAPGNSAPDGDDVAPELAAEERRASSEE